MCGLQTQELYADKEQKASSGKAYGKKVLQMVR
jgi:hypothetical protein